MKRKDLATIILTAFIAGIVSLILAQLIFKSPAKRSTPVPVAPAITSGFPDIKNDPTYNSIFNDKALDPAQPIQIGNNQNSAPFNSSR